MDKDTARKSHRRIAEAIYKILLGIDILVALVVGYFFYAGLTDGSISAFNMQIWIIMVFAIAAIIGGGMALHRAAWLVLANIVLAILAVPAALSVIFIVAFAISGTTWN